MVLKKIKQTKLFLKLQKLQKKYERFLLPAFLLSGVLLDAITFKTLKLSTVFTMLVVHLIISSVVMLFVNYYDNSDLEYRTIYWSYVRLYAPLAIQFSFGALLSASLIFYWFSGSFTVSWPFIVLIALLMASNDIFRKYYLKPVVQIGVYFFILFSISILFLSFLFNTISVWAFVVGSFISLVIVFLYVWLLLKVAKALKSKKFHFLAVIFIVFGGMYFLYFANIIPPMPLSLREAGVYHSVVKQGNDYKLMGEKENLVDKFIPGQTIHITQRQRVYIYTAIFAPADLNARIYHHWQYYNESVGEWITISRPWFQIVGGRDGGFRNYSYSMVKEGRWRVYAETERGQVIGRIKFNVEIVDEASELVEEIR